MAPRIARPAGPQKEPSYQIGIPLDGADRSALQPGLERFDQDDTVQDHSAPPREHLNSTEVCLPEDILPLDEPPPPPVPAPAVPAMRSAPAAPAPAVVPAAASRSSRSSRRTTAVGLAATSAAVPRVSSRRLSLADRSAMQKALLWIGLGVLGAAVVVTAVILLATRGSGDRRAGGEALAEAGRQYEQVKTALSNHRGADARKAYEAALQALTSTPQLGGAVALPSEDKPVVRDLALRAFELRGEVEAQGERITAVQAENAATSNLAALKTRFATLSEAATDLDALEHDVLAYSENPVDPKAGAAPAQAQAFSRLVSETKLRLASIASERDRRRAERTVVPLRLATAETEGLCKQERFGEALARLAELAGQHPDADFAPLRAQVEDAAAKAWRSAKAQVDTRLADWRSPGATEGQRKAALSAAKERLNQVIQRFGVPTYVEQARATLTPLP